MAAPKPARQRGPRGQGSVYYTSGSWWVDFPLGTVGGKRRTKRIRARDEQDAQRKIQRLRRVYAAGGEPATGTLDQYLRQWLEDHEDSISASTATSYRGHIETHISPVLGGVPLAELQPRHVRHLVDELKAKPSARGKPLSAASIVRIITTLRIALNAAVADRSLPDNPAEHIRLPRVRPEPVHAMVADEADAIVNAVRGHWLEPIVRLLLGSGMRLGEATNLDQGDLFLDAEQPFVTVRVSKTGPRAVPISADAAEALREALAAAPRRGHNQPVFFAPRGSRDRKATKRLQGWSVTHALPALTETAIGRRITPHDLRHGAATMMLTAGHQMRVISEQLGHRSPALTARLYAHVVPTAQRAAVAALERRPKG